MSPDAEDASQSPEPGFENEFDDMAVEKVERDSTEEKSPKGSTGSGQPTKPNLKDPSRPRRKKARRACFACQRAHLTCGDERPCLRCIKRGLQDQCHDGVRKKAKYLHDAPPEALMPGFAGNYEVGTSQLPAVPGAAQPHQNGLPMAQPTYYQQASPTNYQQYAQVAQQGQMGPPLMDPSTLVNDFNSQPSVETPTQYQSTSSQQVSPAQDLTNNVDSSGGLGNAGMNSFDSSFFDANDPSLFNFNVSDLNFGNHYGALEFGMLGHMSGAVGTPELDIINPMNNQGSLSYDASNGFSGTYGFNPALPSWQNIPSNTGSRQSSATGLWPAQGNGLDAYAIGEQGSMDQSPHSQGYSTSPELQYVQPEQTQQPALFRPNTSQTPQRKPSAFPGNPGQDQMSRKRRRDTAEIYSSVQTPYSYTQGFHALTAFLQKRFPPKKVLRIAKALANIRPSFISCNQSLDHGDLIFMEKCFQRTLFEYEDFVNHYGTPTVICRRTGEIAAVSKEFSLVTGWRRDVLLGKEPNLNVNTGGSPSGTQTGTSSRGAATPRIPNVELDPGRPQPVFLAELLDEDSVVQFYDDFAELAFGASGTSIIGAPCSLLKYRTKEDPGWGPNDHLADDGKRIKRPSIVKQESLIKGEEGMNALGERDGRVDCSMCWTVKRDVFDIPMLIVMNVSRLDEPPTTTNC
ncbi:Transcriptional regulator of nonfermentable carbon utilization [Elasticomyces elasticus]|nr:Transcriptional regulator of nonfermentable carbon utilization [Elasticomyces elasticus]KAK4922626.1 Transcriptional regulator of nonfermentable carbon utilization [Elasticomyces elasticus]